MPALEPSLRRVDGFREAVAVAEDADFGVVDGVEDIEDVDDAVEVEGSRIDDSGRVLCKLVVRAHGSGVLSAGA